MEFTGRGRVEADTGLSENKCYSVTLALKVKELAFLKCYTKCYSNTSMCYKFGFTDESESRKLYQPLLAA